MELIDLSIAQAAQAAVRGFLDDPGNAALVAHLKSSLGMTRAGIEQGYLRYSLESLATDNDIYASVATHVAMWIEYQQARGVHARRQAVVLEELRRWRPPSIADIGFGAPSRYVRDHVMHNPGVAAELFDKYPAALQVGQAILAHWGGADNVCLTRYDMDADPPITGRACYLFLDSIEHAADPGRTLRATAAAALPGALFLLHLPIGPLIASHSMAWGSGSEALQWLAAAGLEVRRTETIEPNPEFDPFARHEVKLTDLFIVALRH
jgi:hypothetical protein